MQASPIRLPGNLTITLPWYQDEEVLYFSEGEGTTPYDLTTIKRMYNYLIKIKRTCSYWLSTFLL